MIGEIVGNYRILGKLAEGGMGAVWTAEHTMIGRLAAVKVLHPHLTANTDIVNRFFNEAKATTAIKHPGIVEVFDFGYLPTGHAYLVMELLEGMTLAQWRRARGTPIHEGEAAVMLRSVCSALAAAHGKGIIHRDLKPENIFLVNDADSSFGFRVKLLDFGIAKLTDGVTAGSTTTGAVMGTPTYMSPEQCRGTGQVDHRADLYSIGCILYQLLAGRPPFDSEGGGELIGAHLYVNAEPPSAYVTGISPDVVHLVMTLLEKQPERRVQSARDLGAALGAIAQRNSWAMNPSELDVRMSAPSIGMPTPSYSVPSTAPPMMAGAVAAPDQPTTLSGAASATPVPEMPVKKRTGRRIAAVIGALVVGGTLGVVAITITGKSGSSSSTTRPPTASAGAGVKPSTTDSKSTTADSTKSTAGADVKPSTMSGIGTTETGGTTGTGTTGTGTTGTGTTGTGVGSAGTKSSTDATGATTATDTKSTVSKTSTAGAGTSTKTGGTSTSTKTAGTGARTTKTGASGTKSTKTKSKTDKPELLETDL